MKSGFDYKEYEKWVKKLGIAKSQFDLWLTAFLLRQAERVVSKGKPLTPVDTGFLRNSWYISEINVNGPNLEVEIGLSAEYASYQEYGTRFFEGNYMLTISVDEVRKQMPARFNKEFLQWLKNKGVAS